MVSDQDKTYTSSARLWGAPCTELRQLPFSEGDQTQQGWTHTPPFQRTARAPRAQGPENLTPHHTLST